MLIFTLFLYILLSYCCKEEEYEKYIRDAQEERERERQEVDRYVESALLEKQQEYDEKIVSFQQNTEKLADDYASHLVTFRESFIGLQEQSQALAEENMRLQQDLNASDQKLEESVASNERATRDYADLQSECAAATQGMKLQIDEVQRLRVLNRHQQEDICTLRVTVQQLEVENKERELAQGRLATELAETQAREMQAQKALVFRTEESDRQQQENYAQQTQLQNEINELSIQIANRETELSSLQLLQDKTESELTALSMEYQLRMVDLTLARETRRETMDTQELLEEKCTIFSKQLSVFQEERESLTRKIKGLEEKLTETRASVTELVGKNDAAETQLSTQADELSELKKEKEEVSARVIHLEIELSDLQQSNECRLKEAEMVTLETKRMCAEQMKAMSVEKEELEEELARAQATVQAQMDQCNESEIALEALRTETTLVETEWSETCTYLEQKYSASVEATTRLEAQCKQRDDTIYALEGQLQELGEEINNLKTINARSKQANDEMNDRYQELSREFVTSQEMLVAAQQDITSLETELSSLQAEVTHIKLEKTEVQKAFDLLNEDYNASTAEFAQFKQLSTDAIASLQNQHNAELTVLRDQIHEQVTNGANKQRQLDEKCTEHTRLQHELQCIQEQLADMTKERNRLTQACQESVDECVQLKISLDEAHNAHNDSMSTRIREFTAADDEHKSRIETLTAQLTECEARCTAALNDVVTKTATVKALEQNCVSLQTELNALQQSSAEQKQSWTEMEALWQEESDELDSKLESLENEVSMLKQEKQRDFEHSQVQCREAVAEAEARLMQAHSVEFAELNVKMQRTAADMKVEIQTLQGEKKALTEVVASQQMEMVTFSKDSFIKLETEIKNCNVSSNDMISLCVSAVLSLFVRTHMLLRTVID